MEFKDVAIRAAREGGAILKNGFHNIEKVEVKGEHNIVTDVDFRSEEAILKIIKSAFPEHNIIAEETGEQKKDSEFTWYIDPLDGTNNFVMGIPYFSVSIALAKNSEVILGVVYNPIQDELYFAERGKGAFLNDKPITVSSTEKLSDSMIVASFPCEENKVKSGLKTVEKLIRKSRKVIIHFSPALDLCNIARGRIDGIVDDTMPEDHAAGALIVSEAGGKVRDFESDRWNVNKIGIIASNGRIHDEIVKLL